MPAPDSTEPLDITVAISCYNEEAFIADTIDHAVAALNATGHSYEIIVVDDVSRDNSVAKIQAHLKAHPEYPARLVQNKVNRGRANNYIETAFLGRGKYYRMCCGDDSEAPEALLAIFRHIGVADVVIPVQDQNTILGKSPARRRISKTFTFLVNSISGYHIKYYNGMAIHLRSNVMRWPPSSYGFGFEADILTRVLDEGATFVQVPSFGTDRKGPGSSPVNLRNVLSVGHTLLEIAIRRVRRLLYGRSMARPTERPTLPNK